MSQLKDIERKDAKMDKYIIKSYFYNETTLQQRKEIADLLDLVWENFDTQTEQKELRITHRKELSAQSFCCYFDEVLVAYAAVIRKDILHCGEKFSLAGLSCVATHPDFRNLGVGSKLVAAATRYIIEQYNIDLGIFTCQPDLAEFYHSAGAWEACSNVRLFGSNAVGALSSETLKVVVLMRLLSDKAKEHKALFYDEPIVLDFPVGEFI
ncbi:MAG: GNAT family N-acetyltransferase [Clostridia bacterium]